MKLLHIIFAVIFLYAGKLSAVGHNPISFVGSVDSHSSQVQEDSVPGLFQIKPFYIDILAPSSGIQFYKDGIIYLAYSKEEEKIPERHLSFGGLEVFMTKIIDSVPQNIIPLRFSESTVFPTEATTFSHDYNTMYLSIIPPRSGKEKIFMASMQSGKWVIDKGPLNFCDGDYLYTHPALSLDGNFMIFSSDMKGSSGDLDLFITRRENGIWSNPVNIGRNINSPGNELFASLDAENNLFFSSNGIKGKGGYDIFLCKFNGTGWDKPSNLSVINTEEDELAFVINPNDDKSAFYTSRTRSGKSRTQLYSVSIDPLAQKTTKDLSQEFLAISGANNQPDNSLKKSLDLFSQNAPGKRDTIKATSEQRIETPVKHHEIAEIANPDKLGEQKIEENKLITSSADTSGKISNELIYRIQLSSSKQSSELENVKIEGENYPTFEYYYKDAYRLTIGEFSSLDDAGVFQEFCRNNGYRQAFVAAFSGDIRITDQEAKILAAGIKERPARTDHSELIKAETDISSKTELQTPIAEAPSQFPDSVKVIYRVQVLANAKPVGSYVLNVAGRDYKSFEYLYMGGYRTTIGEFSTLTEAARLQNICRQNGYNEAFVVAFRNNVRTNDPELFR